MEPNDWISKNRTLIAFLQGIVTGYLLFYILDRLKSSKTTKPKEFEKSKTKTNIKEDCKMVLLVRTDLQMGKGKVAAQCAHAALSCYEVAKTKSQETRDWLDHWESEGVAKITLKCPDEDEMIRLQKEARKVGLVAKSIHDAGRTQIAAGSRTVLGIGPGNLILISPHFPH
jgi:PTH2 family peptidyl-tRNA hydrolase